MKWEAEVNELDQRESCEWLETIMCCQEFCQVTENSDNRRERVMDTLPRLCELVGSSCTELVQLDFVGRYSCQITELKFLYS